MVIGRLQQLWLTVGGIGGGGDNEGGKGDEWVIMTRMGYLKIQGIIQNFNLKVFMSITNAINGKLTESNSGGVIIIN